MKYLSYSVIIVIVAKLLFVFALMMILQSCFWRVVYIVGTESYLDECDHEIVV